MKKLCVKLQCEMYKKTKKHNIETIIFVDYVNQKIELINIKFNYEECKCK